jgi:hypothetical protein
MFGMSVNEVPGWLVAMAPSGIGVPVAWTPGLVPHCDVLTVPAPAELDEAPAGVVDDPAAVLLLLLLLLLQPAAPRARTAAASTIVLRVRCARGAGMCILIYSPQGGELSQFTVTTILMASGGLLIANSSASAARASGKWCENRCDMAGRLAATRLIASPKSAAVAQLEPMTSISFSGKAPGLTGAEHHHLLARPQPGAGQRVDGHRGGLDEACAVRVQVAGLEDQAGRDLEPLGQAAVEVHADQAEGRADVGPPDAAGIAAAARQQRPERDPVAGARLAVPRVLHDRGHLVALDPRVEVAASGERAHITGKQVEIGTADTHPFGTHDNVTGAGAARSGDVPDHHLAG